MTFFDNSDMKVRMTGKEFLDYKKYKDSLPPMFSKKQVHGIVIISIMLIIGLILASSIQDMFKTPSTSITNKQTFLNSITSLSDLTWDSILKLFFITRIEIIGLVVLFMGIAWMFHGFGFIIIKR